MAFVMNTATQNNATAANNEAWKSGGFLNFYLPTENGEQKKLGAIGLRLNNEDEDALRQWLDADPANLEKLVQHLTVVYRSAEKKPGSGFKLG